MKDRFLSIMHKIKENKQLQLLLGLLLLFCYSFFFVYYLRVIYEPKWLKQWAGALYVFLFVAVLISIFSLLKRLSRKKENLAMALIIFILGLFFVFINPPNQTPDEQGHFLRAYAIYQGEWTFDSGHKYPNDVNLLIEDFPVMYNNGYPAKKDSTISNCFDKYYADLEDGRTAKNMKIIVFQTIPYIFSALGISIAENLGATALGAFYACRLFNLLFYCICVFIALKISKRHKKILFAIASMPLTLFMAASCNSDSFLFALFFLMLGSLFGDEFDPSRSLFFMLCLGILTVHKLSYISFIFLPLLITKDKWKVDEENAKEKTGYFTFIVGTLCLVFLFYIAHMGYTTYFSNYGPLGRTMAETDPSEQLKFMLQYPFRYLAVFINTLLNNQFFIFGGGILGWLDVNIELVNIFTPIIFLSWCVTSCREDDFTMQESLVLLLSGVLTYVVVICGLYLTWTPVGLPQIVGLQMRYFIPAFICFGVVFAHYFKSKEIKLGSNDYSLLYFSTIALALYTAFRLYAVYYLPTHIPEITIF